MPWAYTCRNPHSNALRSFIRLFVCLAVCPFHLGPITAEDSVVETNLVEVFTVARLIDSTILGRKVKVKVTR